MTSNLLDPFVDDLGPEKIIHIYKPESKLRAMVVIDNLFLGPAVGGCRMAKDVTVEEVFRLARAMTLKNSLASLPHGGAKSAIIADPEHCDKETLVREFALAIKTISDYIPGPDMGTDETCMAYIYDEIERAVGLPKVLGGIPLDELGMTGFGLSIAAEVAAKKMELNLEGAKLVVQGFGNVGRAVAKFLEKKGCKLIATCDSKGAVFSENGLNVQNLIKFKAEGNTISQFPEGKSMTHEELLKLESDIFIPAARPDVFRMDNQSQLKTKLVLEGANIPITHEAAKEIYKRGIVIIPDVIANSGGVICAATEYQKLLETTAFERVEETITANTLELLNRLEQKDLAPHEVSMAMARERISEARNYRAHI